MNVFLEKNKIFTTYRYLYIEIFLLVLISLISLTWLKDGELIKFVDSQTSFNPAFTFYGRLFEWKDSIESGFHFPDQVGAVTDLIPLVFYKMGMSLSLVHRATLFVLFLFSLLSSWFFGGTVFGFSINSRLQRLFTSFIYTFGTFSLSFAFVTISGYTFTFSLTPLVLGIFIFISRKIPEASLKKIPLWAVLFSFLVSIFSAFTFGGTNIVVVPFVMGFILISFCVFKPSFQNILKYTTFVFVSALIVFLLNSWWLFSFFNSVVGSHFSGSVSGISGDSASIFKRSSNYTTMYNLFRSMTHQELFSKGGPALDFYRGSWQPVFSDNFIFNILSYIPVLLVILGSIFNTRSDKESKYVLRSLLLTLIILWFLSKQGSPPFSAVNYYLASLPFGDFWRHASDKIGHINALLVATLAADSIGSISFYLKKSKGFFYAFICSFSILFVLVLGYPFWNGDIMKEDGKAMPGVKVLIPNYYWEFKSNNWYKNLDARYVHLPLYYGHIAYKWEKGIQSQMDPIDIYFHGKSEIIPRSKSFIEDVLAIDFFNAPFWTNYSISSDSLGKFLAMFNVSYIINHYDWHRTYIPKEGSFYGKDKPSIYAPWPEDYDLYLSNFTDYETSEYGDLLIYKVPQKYFLHHFYTATGVTISENSPEKFPEMILNSNEELRNVTLFASQNKSKDLNVSIGDPTKVTVEFRKIDPTKYKIVVHNSTEPFLLVFSESFDQGWKIYTDDAVMQNTFAYDNLEKIYKRLDYNEDTQATYEELKLMLEKGIVSTLGNNSDKKIVHTRQDVSLGREVFDYEEDFKIKYISKEINGSVQNDNLDTGKFFDNIFQFPVVAEDNHYVSNGYSNSWLIDPQKICSQNSNCTIKDNSYTFGLTVYFAPQNNMYVGSVISGFAFLLSGVYLFVYRKEFYV